MTKDIVLEVGESKISFITWKSTWNMASFERGKEIEKDVFRLVTSVRRRKMLSPHEERNLRPLDSALRCSTTEPQRPCGELGLLRSS